MSQKLQKMRVRVTRRGDTIRVRVRTEGLPLTDEDHIQFQGIEYELMNTDHFHRIAEGEDREFDL